MSKVTLVTFDNFKNYIGKKVEVEIACYDGGMMYPDNNILLGMNEGNFYFLSEQGGKDEQWWHWTSKSDEGTKGCSIRVWDYIEYEAFYNKPLSKDCEHFQHDHCDCLGKYCLAGK
jgi:hypothetical protein